MKGFSKELKDMLTGFIVSEIGSKGLDGVTYSLKRKIPAEEKDIRDFIAIRKEADKCGYEMDEVFRVFELSDGYIFDMDLKAMTQILTTIAKASVKVSGKNEDMVESVYREPSEIRHSEIKRLARIIENEMKDKDEAVVGVALYNRNLSGEVRMTVTEETGGKKLLTLPAIRARHYDIKTINEQILSKAGMRITKVELEYITLSNSGVKAMLTCKRLQA